MRKVAPLVLTAALTTLTSGWLAPSSQAVNSQVTAKAPTQSASPWWQHAVFYEIYPRSFADSDNNGTGDLKGIASKLDYLKELGVDAIWITPCYPSPQVDFGYDISDYEKIDPAYGTLADFDHLVAEAKKRDIRIVMDLVLNHTSDKSKWFEESRSSKTNPKRNWYIWRDGKPGGHPPNNWQSLFGHSAWTLDPKTKQYYYHFFYPEQPDLNWRNPQVKNAMFDVVRFWLNRGVAGFRLDAIGCLYEDPAMHDNPVNPKKTNQFGDPEMEHKYNSMSGQPELHATLRQLRNVLNEYPGDRVLVGETVGDNISQLSAMFGKHLDEIQLPMDFFFAYVNKLSAPDFRREIEHWDKNPNHGWPVYLFSNHDQIRHYVRYGDGKHNDEIAKLTSALLLTLRGTPIMYYGEELGMTNKDPERVEDVHDPIGKIGWPKEKGRDGERTPMQWSADKNAGFSEAQPWLPVSDNFTTHNVAAEKSDPNSLLNWYKALIHLRKTNDALKNGQYIALNQSDTKVLSYLRKDGEQTVLVALNMSGDEQQSKFDLSAQGLSKAKATTLLASPTAAAGAAVDLQAVKLPPYGVLIARLQ